MLHGATLCKIPEDSLSLIRSFFGCQVASVEFSDLMTPREIPFLGLLAVLQRPPNPLHWSPDTSRINLRVFSLWKSVPCFVYFARVWFNSIKSCRDWFDFNFNLKFTPFERLDIRLINDSFFTNKWFNTVIVRTISCLNTYRNHITK